MKNCAAFKSGQRWFFLQYAVTLNWTKSLDYVTVECSALNGTSLLRSPYTKAQGTLQELRKECDLGVMPHPLYSLPHSFGYTWLAQLLFQHAWMEERLMRPHSQLKSSCQLTANGEGRVLPPPHRGPWKGTLLPRILAHTDSAIWTQQVFCNGYECKGGTIKRKGGGEKGRETTGLRHCKQWMKLSQIKETLCLN